MKELFKISILSVITLFFVGCNDDSGDDQLVPNQLGGIIATISDVTGGIFVEDDGTSSIGFTVSEASSSTWTSYDILVQYKSDGNSLSVLDAGNTSIPATFSYTLADVASATGVSVGEPEVGDSFNFLVRFNSGTGTVTSNKSLTIPVSCPSEIGGVLDYVSTNLVAANSTSACPSGPVTGTVTWTEVSAGQYSTTDLGFGQYSSSCWSDSPATSGSARITEVCGVLGTGGGDQYSLVYTYTVVSVMGKELTLSWANDYGDSGDVVLTRQDGRDWPDLS